MNNTALTDDEGFGLVEAVVSMLILAALAIAFLPLLITGLKQSTTNSTRAFATQLVSDRMSVAQTRAASASTCAGLNLDVPRSPDPRGVEVELVTTVAAVPQQPRLCAVTTVARIVENGTVGSELATASTRVYLGVAP